MSGDWKPVRSDALFSDGEGAKPMHWDQLPEHRWDGWKSLGDRTRRNVLHVGESFVRFQVTEEPGTEPAYFCEAREVNVPADRVVVFQRRCVTLDGGMYACEAYGRAWLLTRGWEASE